MKNMHLEFENTAQLTKLNLHMLSNIHKLPCKSALQVWSKLKIFPLQELEKCLH